MFLFISFIFSYLIGSIPTGYWFAKYLFGIDVTQNGSGNIGATNVARVLGSKKHFFLIFFLDFLKAFLCLLIISFFVPQNILFLNSVFLLFGNAYSIFLKFRGGKGVSTALGILAFLFPFKLFLMFIFCWGLIIYFFKRVGIASLISVYFITIIYYLCFSSSLNYLILLLFLCSWITFRHRKNILDLFYKIKEN